VVTVMVPLLDEGVEVWRPVHAEALPHGRYRIVTENSNPEDERWAFSTGEVVRCEERELEGQCALVAVRIERPQQRECSRGTRGSSERG